MRKVISFDKKLEFKTMIGEVTSISLDPDLKFSDDGDVSGELIISGKYKLTAASRLEDDFLFSLPVEIALSEKLEEDTRNVYVDDFHYQVDADDDILNCHIDLVIEGVEKIDVKDEMENDLENKPKEEISDMRIESNLLDLSSKQELEEHLMIDDHSLEKNEVKTEVVESSEKVEAHAVGPLFSSFKDSDESFATYSVYIIRENDTIDTIMTKYNVHREELEDYNDLDNLMIGTKIIIPTQHE